jgi:hypothetical protein
MSGSGALQAAARAIYAIWQGAAPDWTDDNVPDNETAEDAWEAAEAAYTAIFDHLLGELPEEAVEAARREIDGGGQSYYIAWGYPDEDGPRGKLDADAMARNSAEALLRSLRESVGQ